jgi:6-phosphogluconolactonase
MIGERIEFVNREALATCLARKICYVLSKVITLKGGAVLAVSGGTTPTLLFDHLSRAQISWEKVKVTLVDERQVPDDNSRSNAKLVKEHLLRNRAASSEFVPLFENPQAADLPKFAACVLGMGFDGHTASFFPGGNNLAQAIDPKTSRALVDMSAEGAGEPRITFTLPRIVAATYLALHIEGREKQVVLEKAEGGTDISEMPIRAVLQSSNPIDVYWCP